MSTNVIYVRNELASFFQESTRLVRFASDLRNSPDDHSPAASLARVRDLLKLLRDRSSISTSFTRQFKRSIEYAHERAGITPEEMYEACGAMPDSAHGAALLVVDRLVAEALDPEMIFEPFKDLEDLRLDPDRAVEFWTRSRKRINSLAPLRRDNLIGLMRREILATAKGESNDDDYGNPDYYEPWEEEQPGESIAKNLDLPIGSVISGARLAIMRYEEASENSNFDPEEREQRLSRMQAQIGLLERLVIDWGAGQDLLSNLRTVATLPYWDARPMIQDALKDLQALNYLDIQRTFSKVVPPASGPKYLALQSDNTFYKATDQKTAERLIALLQKAFPKVGPFRYFKISEVNPEEESTLDDRIKLIGKCAAEGGEGVWEWEGKARLLARELDYYRVCRDASRPPSIHDPAAAGKVVMEAIRHEMNRTIPPKPAPAAPTPLVNVGGINTPPDNGQQAVIQMLGAVRIGPDVSASARMGQCDAAMDDPDEAPNLSPIRADENVSKVAETCPLELRDHLPPLIRGKEASIVLDPSETHILEALIAVWPGGLTKGKLERTGGDDAVTKLKRITKKATEFESVIICPGKSGAGGYRISPS